MLNLQQMTLDPFEVYLRKESNFYAEHMLNSSGANDNRGTKRL